MTLGGEAAETGRSGPEKRAASRLIAAGRNVHWPRGEFVGSWCFLRFGASATLWAQRSERSVLVLEHPSVHRKHARTASAQSPHSGLTRFWARRVLAGKRLLQRENAVGSSSPAQEISAVPRAFALVIDHRHYLTYILTDLIDLASKSTDVVATVSGLALCSAPLLQNPQRRAINPYRGRESTFFCLNGCWKTIPP